MDRRSSIGVIVLAYLFYYFNSEAKTAAVLNGTFRQATPLVLAAMCGLLGERTGIVNIGIEGQLLMSAFTGFYIAAATGQHLDRRARRRRCRAPCSGCSSRCAP